MNKFYTLKKTIAPDPYPVCRTHKSEIKYSCGGKKNGKDR